MINGMDHVGSSIHALLQEYHTIAHNMANASTTGYKRKVNLLSRELMQQAGDCPDDALPAAQVTSSSAVDFSQGALVRTDRSLDLALAGKGFFVVETPDGPLYTRNGAFHLNPQGQLVDLSGRLVAGVDAPITVPPGASALSLQVSEDGRVGVDGTMLGRLKVVDFGADEDKLVSAGASCFAAAPDLRPTQLQSPVIRQGYQEQSNVKVMSELVDLISVSRLYETNMSMLRKRHENSQAILGVANT